MKKNTIITVFAIISLFQSTLSQTTTTPSLVSSPAYAVIGPGGDQSAKLLCVAHYEEENPPHRSWIAEGGTLITFDETVLSERVYPSLIDMGNAQHFALKVEPLRLTDEGQYICQITINKTGLKSTVDLHINQYPTTRVIMLADDVLEGTEATIASCHADLSKPAPEMWFEDAYGTKMESANSAMVKECGNGLTNSTLHLSKKSFVRDDMEETYYCKIRHVNRTEPYTLEVEQINVLHAPSAWFVGEDLLKDTVVFPEGTAFSVFCEADGYPVPTIKWTFTPAAKEEETDDENVIPIAVPKNFMIADGNHQILAQSLQVADDGMQTNNGTFTCTALNEIGSASVSFELGVYALPTTTASPTTAAPSTERDDINPNPEIPEDVTAIPQQAGPSAAVIAGIVAVAAFILIVTIVLLLRYFMSHKGEYYTNELKTGEEGRTDLSDDDDLPTTEEELLGEKKRTEHFL